MRTRKNNTIQTILIAITIIVLFVIVSTSKGANDPIKENENNKLIITKKNIHLFYKSVEFSNDSMYAAVSNDTIESKNYSVIYLNN